MIPLASDESKLIKNGTSHEKRLLFLGRITDGSLVTFGIALIFTGLVRLLNIYDSPLSIPQLFQSLVGLFLFILGMLRKSTLFLKTYTFKQVKVLKKTLGFFPFIFFIFFLVYRIQLKDIGAYGRLVEEGSLVEWLSFLFLLFSALLFLNAGKQELNKLARRFTIMISGLTFVLAMEEVSWGQMIFNWKSPDFFTLSNSQEETNIHNLIYLSGEPNTIIVTLVLSSLTLFCLLRWYLGFKINFYNNKLADLAFPPLFLIGYFSLGALVYLGLVLQMKGLDIPLLIPGDQEIFECFFALGILVHSCKIYINWGRY